MPSREAQAKAFVKRAIRVTRQAYRKADTSGEVLERWLDRQLKRKTITSRPQGEAIIPLWENYRDLVKGLELAVVDLLNVLLDPIWAP